MEIRVNRSSTIHFPPFLAPNVNYIKGKNGYSIFLITASSHIHLSVVSWDQFVMYMYMYVTCISYLSIVDDFPPPPCPL